MNDVPSNDVPSNDVPSNDFWWVFPALYALLLAAYFLQILLVVALKAINCGLRRRHARRAARRNANLDRVMREMDARESDLIRACIAQRAEVLDEMARRDAAYEATAHEAAA